MSALPRPDLTPGPHEDLNDALHDLHHRAGWLSLRSPAKETNVSHTTLSTQIALLPAADCLRGMAAVQLDHALALDQVTDLLVDRALLHLASDEWAWALDLLRGGGRRPVGSRPAPLGRRAVGRRADQGRTGAAHEGGRDVIGPLSRVGE